jgi:hypothetical protein
MTGEFKREHELGVELKPVAFWQLQEPYFASLFAFAVALEWLGRSVDFDLGYFGVYSCDQL